MPDAPHAAGFQSFFAIPADDSTDNPCATIISRCQQLKTMRYRRLAEFVDVVKGRRERLFIVSEHYPETLQSWLTDHAGQQMPEECLKRVLYQILQGLAYLNSHGMVHRALSAQSILLVPHNNPDDPPGTIHDVKISGWALPFLSRNGRHAGFGIGFSSTMVILANPCYSLMTRCPGARGACGRSRCCRWCGMEPESRHLVRGYHTATGVCQSLLIVLCLLAVLLESRLYKAGCGMEITVRWTRCFLKWLS